MTDYLPKAATIEQACAWLEQQTGSAWTLARLLECGSKPWFWLDYSTDAPKELFGGKTEGYLAPMIFAGDTHRLEMYGEFALVTMTRTHDDNLIKMTPGMRLDLSEIRFKRESLERVAKIINESQKKQPAFSSGAPESAEPPWKTEAVILGNKYIKAWRDEGYEPTGADAALYIEGEFFTLGIYGKHKEVLDAAYIARHALTGITGNKPGHKSKKPKVPDGKRSKLP